MKHTKCKLSISQNCFQKVKQNIKHNNIVYNTNKHDMNVY